MAENSHISWTDNTSVERVAAFRLSQIANAVRLVVFQFVAVVAQRQSVANIESQLRVGGEWLQVMRTKISAAFVTTLLTGEFVASENRKSPLLVFDGPAVAAVSLAHSMREGVVLRSAWCSLASYSGDSLTGLFRVLHAKAIASTSLSRKTHLEARFNANSCAF